ncbi:hypothetical protein H633G_11421 [Metarhizium anisopliae BRIP 53284]|nr:hypothetical protein H633G_11421 [Metarhizium anisopliae BRIP 53284]
MHQHENGKKPRFFFHYTPFRRLSLELLVQTRTSKALEWLARRYILGSHSPTAFARLLVSSPAAQTIDDAFTGSPHSHTCHKFFFGVFAARYSGHGVHKASGSANIYLTPLQVKQKIEQLQRERRLLRVEYS